MDSKFSVSASALACATILGASGAVKAQESLCGPFSACVVITYPANRGKPIEVNPDKLEINESVRKNQGMFAFVVATDNGQDTIIKFKCQTASGPDRDCRTPAVASGNPQWDIRVKANGNPQPVRIPAHLEKCDAIPPGASKEQWKKANCTYSYSVQDEAKLYELLDPDVIIDPR